MAADPLYDEASKRNFARLLTLIQTTGANVVIGAGPSVGAGLLNWSKLLQVLCDEAGVTCQEVSSRGMPNRLQELRATIGEGQALNLLRFHLGQPIRALPRVYEISTQAFRIKATTNYDGFLEAAAWHAHESPRIWAYPMPIHDADFYYLHGRLSTATNIRELVLCQDDYENAYTESGHVRSRLSQLFLGHSCVFVGFSLEDAAFMRVLESIEESRRRLASLGGTSTGFYQGDPDWFAFKAVPDPDLLTKQMLADIPDVEKRRSHTDRWVKGQVRDQSSRLKDFGVKPIWYVRDAKGPHLHLESLLERLADAGSPTSEGRAAPVFLPQARELEDLASVETPNHEQVDHAKGLMRSLPEARRIFFARPPSPAWFQPLHEAGLLKDIVQEPITQQDGTTSVQLWEAEPFFFVLVVNAPEAAVTLIKQIETANWHVLSCFARALLELPLQRVSDLDPVTTLRQWLDTPFGAVGTVEHNAVLLVDHLANAGNLEQAGGLVGMLLEPRRSENGGAQTRVSSLYAEDVVEAALRLVDRDANHVVSIFHKLLVDATAIEFGDEDVNISWTLVRPAIEDHEANYAAYNTLNLLVAGLRDAVAKFVTQDENAGTDLLQRYLRGDAAILRRIALYTVNRHPALIPSLEGELFAQGAIFDPPVFHEAALLLRNHFQDLSKIEQERITLEIQAGPARPQREASDLFKDRWRWRVLSVIPQALVPDSLAALKAQLAEQFDPLPDPTFFQGVARRSEKPPITNTELRRILLEEGAEPLLAVLRNPGTRFHVGWTPREPSGFDATRGLVIEQPVEMLELAPLLTPADFRVDEAAWYLEGYAELLGSGIAFDWEPLVRLGLRTSDAIENPEQEPSHAWLIGLGRLFRQRVAGAHPIPPELLHSVALLLMRILRRYRTPLDTSLIEEDVSFHHLNSVAGIAADALLNLANRVAQDREHDDSQRLWTTELSPLINPETLGERGGRELLYATAAHLAELDRFEEGWLEGIVARFSAIAPPHNRAYLQSFWSGYLSSPAVSSDAMRALLEQYREVILLLWADPDAPSLLDRDLQSRLAEHVAMGWLGELGGFGLEGLLGDLAKSAPDPVLSALAWYLGKRLELVAHSEDIYEQVWGKLRAYWDTRAAAFANSAGHAEQVRIEANRLIGWLKHVKATPREIAEPLRTTIPKVSIGGSLGWVTDYLLTFAESDLSVVTDLARAIAQRWVAMPTVVWHADQYGTLLEHIARGGSAAERVVLTEIVELLLREDKADFRSLLRDPDPTQPRAT